MIVQKPRAFGVTMEPETVHTSGVSERNDTVSPEDAVAVRVTGWPTAVSFGYERPPKPGPHGPARKAGQLRERPCTARPSSWCAPIFLVAADPW